MRLGGTHRRKVENTQSLQENIQKEQNIYKLLQTNTLVSNPGNCSFVFLSVARRVNFAPAQPSAGGRGILNSRTGSLNTHPS